jgi:hypothetical protein
VNIWDIKASKMMKKATGAKASRKMKKPAGANACDMPSRDDLGYTTFETFLTDSETEQDQFKPGFVGGFNYIGAQGGGWTTLEPKMQGYHRRFCQINPPASDLATVNKAGRPE